MVKRSGEIEPFDRRKILTSIEVASAKRPIGGGEIDEIVDDIERVLDQSDVTEVPSGALGEMVMVRLKARDHIAYVRFASVYRNFQDLTEFYEELRDLDERSTQLALRRYQQELQLGFNGEVAHPAPETAKDE